MRNFCEINTVIFLPPFFKKERIIVKIEIFDEVNGESEVRIFLQGMNPERDKNLIHTILQLQFIKQNRKTEYYSFERKRGNFLEKLQAITYWLQQHQKRKEKNNEDIVQNP